MYYRAFYVPPKGSYSETVVDAEKLEDIPSGSILVIFRNNQDGTRTLISEKENPTKKEKYFIDLAKPQLEFKSDGGGNTAHEAMLRENRKLIGELDG